MNPELKELKKIVEKQQKQINRLSKKQDSMSNVKRYDSTADRTYVGTHWWYGKV